MSAAPIPWKHIRNVLVLFAPLWLGCTLLFATIGLLSAIFSSPQWSARQPLVVRDEATGATERLGRFASQTELKAAQETILEMARNPEVVGAALRQLGPPDGGVDTDWPSVRLIDEVAEDSINVIAPQGSEFGGSDLIYLSCKASSKERATELCRAVLDNLTTHLRSVRRIRADSVIIELQQARDLTRLKLDNAVERIQAMEVGFGSDLGELRSLTDSISGDGTTQRTMAEIRRDLRVAQTELESLRSIQQVLINGSKDPQSLLISGNDLLANQPSLERLKDGLIDAQIESSRLAGVYTDAHPLRKAAIKTEFEIKERILQESEAAARAMNATLALAQARVDRLNEQADQSTARLARLAQVRSSYSKIDSEVEALKTQLAQAEAALSDAQASRSAALSTNLLAELGPPQTGDQPVGLSGSIKLAGSTAAGLIFGLGTVFLIAPGPTGTSYGRRWSDYLGRRASDRGATGSDRRSQPRGGPDRRSPEGPSDETDRRAGGPV
ncbi:MAG: hypothetical protein AAGD07_07845 [Planctomycetota bacterium]